MRVINRLKILLVSTSALPSPPNSYGGLEWIVWGLAETLPKLGHQVTLFTTNDSLKIGHYDYGDGSLDVIATGPSSWDLNGERTMYQNYKNRLDEYDVIIDHSWYGYPYLSMKNNPSLKVIHIHHGNTNWRNPHTGAYIAPPVTWPRMCGISKPHAAQLSQQFGRPLRYVHNGIPLQPLPEPVNDGYLLSLNRIAPYKGIMDSIDVALQTGHKIIVAGDDQYVESQDFVAEVIDRCRQSGGQATYYGSVDNDTKWDLLKRCKAMIACPHVTTFQEAFGLYAVEAGMYGKPIIALANGGLMDIIINEKTGLLGSTPARLVEIIDKLDNIKPEDCRQNIEDNFTWETMSRNYAEMAAGVVNDRFDFRW